MEDKRYFKKMLFAIGTVFLFTCFSIIYCIVNSSAVEATQKSSHIMSIVYLVFQLFMEAVVFYYAFKAMVEGSSLIKNVMYIKEDIVNKKSKRNSLIFFIFSALIFAYSTIIIFPVNIFLSFFALGLKFALANFFALVSVVSICFYCYPKEKKE